MSNLEISTPAPIQESPKAQEESADRVISPLNGTQALERELTQVLAERKPEEEAKEKRITLMSAVTPKMYFDPYLLPNGMLSDEFIYYKISSLIIGPLEMPDLEEFLELAKESWLFHTDKPKRMLKIAALRLGYEMQSNELAKTTYLETFKELKLI